MKTKSHISKIKEQVISALSSDKETLIKGFAKALKYSSKLLNTDKLGFWEKQLKENKWELIAITKLGVKEELESWRNYEPSFKTLLNRLQGASEKILVYWEEDDLCEMQGQFFYYKDETTKKVFKESEYGNEQRIEMEGNKQPKTTIALIPDLNNSALIEKDIYSDLYQ